MRVADASLESHSGVNVQYGTGCPFMQPYQRMTSTIAIVSVQVAFQIFWHVSWHFYSQVAKCQTSIAVSYRSASGITGCLLLSSLMKATRVLLSRCIDVRLYIICPHKPSNRYGPKCYGVCTWRFNRLELVKLWPSNRGFRSLLSTLIMTL